MPETRSAGSTCPVGTYPRTASAKKSPSVTKLTDMKEKRNASNFDHPFTSPVALRRNRVGPSPVTVAIFTPPQGRNGRSAVHQLVVLDLPLLRIDVDDRRLQDALFVGTAGVQRERRPDPCRALALVAVPVQREQRLERLDGVPDRGGTDGSQRLPTRLVRQVLVQRGGVVELRSVGGSMEVEDG